MTKGWVSELFAARSLAQLQLWGGFCSWIIRWCWWRGGHREQQPAAHSAVPGDSRRSKIAFSALVPPSGHSHAHTRTFPPAGAPTRGFLKSHPRTCRAPLGSRPPQKPKNPCRLLLLIALPAPFGLALTLGRMRGAKGSCLLRWVLKRLKRCPRCLCYISSSHLAAGGFFGV